MLVSFLGNSIVFVMNILSNSSIKLYYRCFPCVSLCSMFYIFCSILFIHGFVSLVATQGLSGVGVYLGLRRPLLHLGAHGLGSDNCSGIRAIGLK